MLQNSTIPLLVFTAIGLGIVAPIFYVLSWFMVPPPKEEVPPAQYSLYEPTPTPPLYYTS